MSTPAKPSTAMVLAWLLRIEIDLRSRRLQRLPKPSATTEPLSQDEQDNEPVSDILDQLIEPEWEDE